MLTVNKVPTRVAGMAQYPDTQDMRARFVRQSRFGDTIVMWRPGPNGSILVPRSVCPDPQPEDDHRTDGVEAEFECEFTPRNEQQVRVINETYNLLLEGKSFVVEAPTGSGKCLAPEEPVLLHDGSVVCVGDLSVGDHLMGPDGKPRRVLATNPGHGPMYRVIPNKGRPWRCNDVHILSLRCTAGAREYGSKGDVVNVPLNEWLEWPKSKKHVYKLWRSAVDFPRRRPPLMDPYFLGVLLGDGTTTIISVTTMDPEIEAVVRGEAAARGMLVREETGRSGKATTLVVSTAGRWSGVENTITTELDWYGLTGTTSGNKFIPDDYRMGSRDTRLEVLAGLLDTDGYLESGTVYDYISKSAQLAHDVAFIARSLGLAAYVKAVKKQCTNTGVWGVYYRLSISGHTDKIPCRVPRKKASPRRQIKDVTNVGFRVEPEGDGEYFGVVIDGDRLFMLDDFTVVHNTSMMMPVIANMGVRTLIVVHKADLMDRWLEDIEKMLKIKPKDVGVIKQGKYDVAGKDIVIAFCQSVWKPGKYPDWVFDQFGLVIYDEIHRCSTEKFQAALGMIPAKLRVGLSATPNRTDGQEFVAEAHIGEVMVRAHGLPMVPKILVYDSNWVCPKWKVLNKDTGAYEWQEAPHGKGRIGAVIKHMAGWADRNRLICECAHTAWEAGRHVVVMCDAMAHLETIRVGLRALDVPKADIALYVGGLTPQEREDAKTKPVLLGTYKMMQEGTDIPILSALVMGTPKANVKQIVGRVCREHPGKPQPVVFDIRDKSREFTRYAARRRQVYAELKAEVKVMA